MKQKDKSVDQLTRGVEGLFKKNGAWRTDEWPFSSRFILPLTATSSPFLAPGVTYVKAAGKLVGPNEVECTMVEGGGTQKIKAKKIMLAVGSEVTPFPGGSVTIDEEKVCNPPASGLKGFEMSSFSRPIAYLRPPSARLSRRLAL